MIDDSSPVEHVVHDITDPETEAQVLLRVFPEHVTRPAGGATTFHARLRATFEPGGMVICAMQRPARAVTRCRTGSRLSVLQVRRNGVTAQAGRTALSLRDGSWCTYDTTRPMTLESSDDCLVRAVHLDLDTAQAVADGLTDRPTPFRLDASAPIDPDHARFFSDVVDHVEHNVLHAEHLMRHPLIRQQARSTLASALLTCFPNPVLDALRDPTCPPAGSGTPALVRRAIDYIDEHAGEPITVTDVAAAVGTGARTLRRAFRRHRDTTPSDYLRRVRLERAHHELLAADPGGGDAIASIAARWGFAHPDRFAVDHRRHYGSPRSTPAGRGRWEVFGPYRLLELLGRGGMGEVWRAYDSRHHRVVALKRLAAEWAGHGEFRERFRREARATEAVDSAHVVQINDVGEIDGQLFIDMRLVDGGDLAHALDRAADGFDPQRAAALTAQIADGLDAAHRLGLLHRDVKPSNVLLDRDPGHGRGGEHAYLVDFGIVKSADESLAQGLTRPGDLLGTPAYMAPELFGAAGAADVASDVYALGCVLFEMLTERRPYVADSASGYMGQHLTWPVPLPSGIRPGLAPFDPVITRALDKDPARRYPSAGALGADALAAARSVAVAPTLTGHDPAAGPGRPW